MSIYEEVDQEIDSLRKNYYLLTQEDMAKLYDIVSALKALNKPKNPVRRGLEIKEFN